MKTQEIKVTSSGLGIEEALELTEKTGSESGLQPKENLHLRLLAEELLGMVRSIVREVEADYWIEAEGKDYALHLKSDPQLNKESYSQLISVSSRNENDAARGFMGKLRNMIEVALLPDADGPSLVTLELMSMGSPGGYSVGNENYEWSLKKYKTGVEDESEAWDELEKSIVASIADDVHISIEGSHVEITILKSFLG